MEKISSIIKTFNIKGEIISIDQLIYGLINKTYLIVTEEKKYILQMINTNIFNKPKEMMRNIETVNNHLKNKRYRFEILELIHTKSKSNLYFDKNNNPWRCYKYIQHNSDVYKELNNNLMLEYGKAIGHFHECLSDIDKNKIINIIPEFHNTIEYFNRLENLMTDNRNKRTYEVLEYYDAISVYKNDFDSINRLISSNKLPKRVCHNDTKIENILFHKNNKIVKSIIDFDTVMNNSIIYDFGDAIRSVCDKSANNETNTKKITFNTTFFKHFLEGYLIESKKFISARELKLIGYSPILVSLEQAIRFFIDYIQDDIYYPINYPKHNLERGVKQLFLAQNIISKKEEIENIINSVYDS